MARPPDEIPTQNEDGAWRVIVETPKGSQNKHRYDLALRVFELARPLPEGLAAPFDFGFLPSTKAEDGDPVDLLLPMDPPTFPGCVIASRLVGVIEGVQTESDGSKVRNDRPVAVPVKSRRMESITLTKHLEPYLLEEIPRFFEAYNDGAGRKSQLVGFHGPKHVEHLVREHRTRRCRSKFRWLEDRYVVSVKPFYLWHDATVPGHAFLCTMGLLLLRYLQWELRSLNLSMKELVEALEGIRVVRVRTAEGKAKLVLEPMGREEARVFAALHLERWMPK